MELYAEKRGAEAPPMDVKSAYSKFHFFFSASKLPSAFASSRPLLIKSSNVLLPFCTAMAISSSVKGAPATTKRFL